MKPKVWQGCYRDLWQGLLVPTAFAHPAKFAPGLIKRIFQHCLDQGHCKPESVVLDPFAGIGGGGIFAPMFDLQWIGIELEQKFVDLARQNFDLHRHAWETMGYPMPRIIQGDSRNLRDIIQSADCCIMSPPYAEGGGHGGNPDRDIYTSRSLTVPCDHYGTHPAQIGNMKPGSIDSVVTSPPWEDKVSIQDKDFYRKKCIQTGRNPESGHTQNIYSYGQTPGQIGSTSSDTYWDACRDIYAACYDVLKLGGIIVIVVKAYIKKGRRVPLPMQTLKLLLHLGFEPLERIKAMLVEEQVSNGLFGEIKQVKERKSFFRRLAEKKGSPPIDWEEVLICRKPLTEN